MRHKAKGAVIGMIVDEEAAKALPARPARATSCDRGIGAKVGYAGEKPVEADWRVVQARQRQVHRHRPVLWRRQLPDRPDGAGHRRGERRLGGARRQAHPGRRPGDVPPCRRRAGNECRSSALKSTVHFRADFQPIAETILCVRSPGAAISDPTELPYRNLRSGVRLRPLGPQRR